MRHALHRQPAGSALVAALCLFVGVIIGVALAIAPRFFNFDPFKLIRPDKDKTEEKTVPPAINPSEQEVKSLLDDLQKRKASLDKRDADLMQAESKLATQQAQLDDLKKAMDATQQKMEAAHVQIADDQEANTKKIGKIWAKMDPGEVKSLVKNLGVPPSVKILSTMKEDVVAPILSAIAKDDAKTATQVFEELNRMKQKPKMAASGEGQ